MHEIVAGPCPMAIDLLLRDRESYKNPDTGDGEPPGKTVMEFKNTTGKQLAHQHGYYRN
jgi:hypothetical protein